MLLMLKITNLDKIYKMGKGNTVHALKEVSFSVDKGHVVAIVGPSGSGKSTILNILGGLDLDFSGEVLVDNKELKDFKPNQYHREILGTIFQQFYLIPSLTVEENIALPIKFGKQMTKAEAAERLEYLLDKVGLTDRRKHLPSELSGGQAQRVAIARALMNKPKVLLADEPTGNLDSKTGQEIVDLLFELNQEEKTTLIIVTHDKEIIRDVNKIMYLKDGRIIENK